MFNSRWFQGSVHAIFLAAIQKGFATAVFLDIFRLPDLAWSPKILLYFLDQILNSSKSA